MERMGNNKQHLFVIFHQRLFDTIRYQLKTNLHNFGKRLENMIVKVKQEHSMIKDNILIHVVLSTVP